MKQREDLLERQGILPDDLARAVELMQVRVDYEREIAPPDADKHAAEVETIRSTNRSSPLPN